MASNYRRLAVTGFFSKVGKMNSEFYQLNIYLCVHIICIYECICRLKAAQNYFLIIKKCGISPPPPHLDLLFVPLKTAIYSITTGHVTG